MEIPTAKCMSCGKMIQLWRCGEMPGGGTYHIVCFDCSERDSRQSTPLTAVGQWIGWMLVAGLMIGTTLMVVVLGGL
jgi:hypothetical protein